ncbi:MAG: hypothetical protein ACQEQN_11785, partial [Thermodesulfobacteriota bacterium]
IMGIILLYVLRRFPPDYQGASLSLLFYVVSAIMAGTVIYMGISLVLQKNEMKAVASMVKRP